jgi:hypothetical protein
MPPTPPTPCHNDTFFKEEGRRKKEEGGGRKGEGGGKKEV